MYISARKVSSRPALEQGMLGKTCRFGVLRAIWAGQAFNLNLWFAPEFAKSLKIQQKFGPIMRSGGGSGAV